MKLANILLELESLVIFRGLKEHAEIIALVDALEAIEAVNLDANNASKPALIRNAVGKVAEFNKLVVDAGGNWTKILEEALLANENPYAQDRLRVLSQSGTADTGTADTGAADTGAADTGTDNTGAANTGAANTETANTLLAKAAEHELAFLEELSKLSLDNIAKNCSLRIVRDALSNMPGWKTETIDLPSLYEQRLAQAHTLGFGIFSKHHVFTLENGSLMPVKHPDPQQLSDLPGYEPERSKIIENTEALLAGHPASNVLLYGDAGTGKSSTVKAIANEYANRGLRLIEIRKRQLFELPLIIDSLASNPLKFIIFVDDLSFVSGDDDFAALKAILEGGVCGNAPNIVVYATSNRRHLIKETLEDRQGTDLHEADTRQEMMSLSARFGLIVTFSRPDSKRYAAILEKLAADADLTIDSKELLQRGEAFAIRAGGRSPRAARQFIDLLSSGLDV